MRALSIALLSVAAGGCYSYAPLAANTEPKPATPLRVELTLTGGDSLARFLGPSVQMVDGKLVQMTPTAIELGVTQVVMYSGMEQYWKGETVTVPKPYVAKIEERTFSWTKTGLLSAVIVGAMVAFQSAGGFQGIFGNGNHTGNPQ